MGQSMIVTGQPHYAVTPAQTTGANFTAPAVTGTKPTLSNSCLLYDFQQWQTNTLPSLLRIMPMSDINNGTSVGMRIIGWNSHVQASGTAVYFPTILGEFVLTYTSGTVPSFVFDAYTLYMFSGITHVAGTPAPNRYSPATTVASDVAPASILIDAVGSQYVTADFKSSGSAKMVAFWYAI